ncbi:MAG TPA: hypothetical protein VHO71_03365 [Caproiciproducens sp.]|nr:hypothetical protein [Caproiciproducens sp.]
MKRLLCVFISFSVFIILFGCGSGPERTFNADDIELTFQCKADISYNGQTISGSISRAAPGIVSVQITSGGLNGLTYYWTGENFDISYSGLTAKNQDCVLPKTSLPFLIRETLDSAAKTGALTKTHGNEFSGSASGYDYTLKLDESSGKISEISIPKYGIDAKLHDYSELGV